MESKKFFLLGCVIASSFHSVVFAGALDELNTADQAKVKSGELVETFEDVGKAWPKIRVYQKINAYRMPCKHNVYPYNTPIFTCAA